MIKVTNNVADFIEKDPEVEVVIYGAGNAGKWIGYYIKKVGLDFAFYVDKKVSRKECLLNNRPIFNPDKLGEYKGRPVKIIVSPRCYKEISSDLLWLDRKYNFNALCLVPQFHDFMVGDERYNINKLLGYFRRKLVSGETPTFITNDCTAGFLYESLGMMLMSPLINTGFEVGDYIKLCQAPAKYLNMDLSDLHWEQRFEPDYKHAESPVGYLGDLRICFAHDSTMEGISERWSMMRANINWNRLVFVMQDGHFDIPIQLIKEFDALKEKHLFVNMRTHYGYNSENIVFFKEDWLHSRECVIENNFDILGWINKE